MMSRHARTHNPQPTPPATPVSRKPDAQRPDTAGAPRPTAQTAPAKISDAKSQANPMTLAAPQRRLSSDEEFQLIQMRAYYLWQQAGRPDGDKDREHFWFQAEREIAAPRPGA
jgi:hypothetical protein